ncbi:MAG: glycosyltransferase [Candidatus Acidiferrales bacterium]
MMMVSTPRSKVTAIIPVYNCAQYVTKAIDSVLAQTYPAREIIVVDDGSTDGTREVLQPYMNSIIYVYQKNAGEPAARNTGIRHATGEYIAYLDADDLWLPDKLQLQMEYFVAHPECKVVYTDMMTFDSSGILVESVRASRGRIYQSGKIFPYLFRETLFGSGSVVFSKDCCDTVGLFDESFLVGSDYEMWLRMARYFEFGYVDKPLLMYRQHREMSTQTLGQVPQDGMPWQAKVLNRILELYPEIRGELGESFINRRMAVPYVWLGRTWMNRGNHVEARKLFAGAVQRAPWSFRYRLIYLCTFLTPSTVSKVTNLYRKVRSTFSSKHQDASHAKQSRLKHEGMR